MRKFTGNLSLMPLADLIQWADNSTRSGTLILNQRGLQKKFYIQDGKIMRNSQVRLLRDNVVVFQGKLGTLRRFKDDVAEVKNGYECGIAVKNYNDVRTGDQIEVYEIVEIQRTL